MQDFIQQLSELLLLIDLKLALLIIISSYWVKANFSHVWPQLSLALKIFIWSTLLSFVYYFIGKEVGFVTKESYIDLIITYFAATSFYEVAFKPLEKIVKNLLGGKAK